MNDRPNDRPKEPESFDEITQTQIRALTWALRLHGRIPAALSPRQASSELIGKQLQHARSKLDDAIEALTMLQLTVRASEPAAQPSPLRPPVPSHG